MSGDLELLLFAIDAPLLARAIDAGIDGVVVDWERQGKHRRQRGRDTEINAHTESDLERVRSSSARQVICRVNPVSATGIAEIEKAAERGADEVLLPMVRSAREVERALAAADGRLGVGVLLETMDAVRCASEIARPPITRAYLGLNDLAIERGTASIFTALVDGTVDAVRERVAVPFGLAGVTAPGGGHPLPCRLLIGELARLDARFTFLRRSFRRDVPPGNVGDALAGIRAAARAARSRGADEIARDRDELVARIRAIDGDARQAGAA